MKNLATLFLAGALVSACSPSEPNGQFAVSVSVSPLVFKAGEAVTVVTTITNLLKGPVRVGCNGSPYFTVFSEAGQRVGPEPHLCDLSAVVGAGRNDPELQPGETRSFSDDWRAEVPRPSGSDQPVYLPPGRYRIRGQAFSTESRDVVVQFTGQ